jgi:alkylhydroperoxidase/carboxymuconolactone decarboxylase family protein YurZ
LKGLDAKTKQLINIAIQTVDQNPTGVQTHVIMAKCDNGKKEGATHEEIIGAVVLTSIIPVLLKFLSASLQRLRGLKTKSLSV